MSFTWLTSGRFLNTFISIHTATIQTQIIIRNNKTAHKNFQNENFLFQEIFLAHSDRFFELEFNCL
jgi:hypothetical protein